ncbi:MAG TPA: SCP2 sterol-binding domain-containing protein [Solirubrobacterales bacterium]|nr:SCP2 sterol-binding domain-containing protein [Solirubrobacterales bacterium]
MSYFTDADEVYATLGKLFSNLATDPDLGPRLRRANTTVQFAYRDPESQITIRLDEDAEPRIDLGPTDLAPEVTMTSDADIAHRFWLGRVNITLAMARGEIRAEGPMPKLMALMPITEEVFPRYRAMLAADGRQDLIEA